MGQHEAANAHRAALLDARDDVDHGDCADGGVGHRRRKQRHHAAKGRADNADGPALAKGAGDKIEILGEQFERIMRLVRPTALAVSAQVERDRLEALCPHRFHRAAPAMPRLPAAMREDHEGRAGTPLDVADDGRAPRLYEQFFHSASQLVFGMHVVHRDADQGKSELYCLESSCAVLWVRGLGICGVLAKGKGGSRCIPARRSE